MSSPASVAPTPICISFHQFHWEKLTMLPISLLAYPCLASGYALKRCAPQLSSRACIALTLATTIIPTIFAAVRWKKILFEATLLWTSFNCWQNNYSWWNEITPNIVLGAIPLEEQGPALEAAGITAHLTMLEESETDPGLVRMWRHPLHHKIIHAPDFRGVPAAMIEEGVQWVRAQVEAGRKVYINCKAGRGRSATIVVAYLMRYGTPQRPGAGLSFEQAYRYVQQHRRQINLNPHQQAAIQTWAGRLR